MTERIYLNNLKLNHFTIQDAELYCQIFNINPDNIIVLELSNNNLTDISGVSIFKNLTYLTLNDNLIHDINSLKHLVNLELLKIYSNTLDDISQLSNLNSLEELFMDNLSLKDELKAVKILKNLPSLQYLHCKYTFNIIDIKKELKGINVYD